MVKNAASVLEVLPTSEVRKHLGETLQRFRGEGVAAAPMVFGAHRRPEGVVISYQLFMAMSPFLDDLAIAAEVKDRLESNNGQRLSWEDGLTELGFKPNDFE